MGGSATVAPPRGAPSGVPWWKRGWARVTGLVLSLGALASAVSAIVALWPGPDVVDSAAITSIDVFSPVSLIEYEGRAAVLAPRGAGVSAPSADMSLVAAAVGAATPTGPPPTSAPATEPVPEPTTVVPITPTTELPPTTADPTTTGPTSTSPSTSTATGTATQPTPGPGGLGRVLPRVHDLAPLYVLPTTVTDPNAPLPPMLPIIRAAVTDADGDPVLPQVAARRVTEFLGDTRIVRTPAGRKVPQGAVVDVNVVLEGLRDNTVQVSWSIWNRGGEHRLYGNWLRQITAFQLTASTDHDTAAFQLWVPLPKRPGAYVVRLQISDDNAVLVSRASKPFG